MAYLGNNPRPKLWNVDTPEEVDAKIVTAVAALVDSAPSTLDTLNELAASLGDDANFATSVSTSLGTKVDKTTTVNGHALSGNITVTKSDVSLGNVDNTSDANKPVSTAQATAIAGKQPLDADLTAIAGLAGTTGLLKKTAADTWSLDTNAYVTSSGVTSVTGTAPIASSGGAAPAISITAATSSAAGSMSSADKTKLDGIASGATANTGTVTSVGGTGSYGGLTLTGTVTTTGDLALGGTPTGTWPISVSGSATSATTATNLAGGSLGTIPYQSDSGTTAQLAAGTSGYYLKSNGAAAPSWAAVAAGGLPSNSQTFTSSGTFTVPTGVTKVLVWACGGGGSGAGGYYTTHLNGAAGGSTYFGSINFFGAYISIGAASSSVINGAGGRNGNGSGSKSGALQNDGADGTYAGGGITAPYNGSGVGGNATNIGAGGGGVEGHIGGGSSCMDFELVSVTPGQVITVTIGAGGAGVSYASPYTISGTGYRGEVRVYW